MSQVKLRPTGALKEPKDSFVKKETEEPIPSKPKTTTVERNEIPILKKELNLPPVPKDFGGKVKEYPSGAKKGLTIFETVDKKKEQMAKLERELKEAALREDFELCVDLKKQISQLRLT